MTIITTHWGDSARSLPAALALSAISQRLVGNTYGSGYEGSSLPGLSVGYEYDSSGNMMRRKLDLDTTPGVAAGSYAETAFTPNTRNQLDNRTSPGYLSVGGTATAGTNVAIGASNQTAAGATTRVGAYFHRAIPISNSAGWQAMDATVVVQATGTPTYTAAEVRTGYVAPAATAFAYDDAGNLTSDGECSYAWDILNRLQGIVRTGTAASVEGVLEQAYLYNPENLRVEKRYVQGTAAGKRTRYLYAGMDLLAEIDVTVDGSGTVTSSSLAKSYHWRPTGIGRAGRLLEIVDRTNGRAALAGYDGRGNLTTWSDAATGSLLGGRDYDPYGQGWYETWYDAGAKISFANVGFGFSTEYKDETGLVYFGFRYYRPELGRFISRDPAGETGSGVNLYAFAGNDPVNNRELYGLCPFNFGDFLNGLRKYADRFKELYSDLENLFEKMGSQDRLAILDEMRVEAKRLLRFLPPVIITFRFIFVSVTTTSASVSSSSSEKSGDSASNGDDPNSTANEKRCAELKKNLTELNKSINLHRTLSQNAGIMYDRLSAAYAEDGSGWGASAQGFYSDAVDMALTATPGAAMDIVSLAKLTFVDAPGNLQNAAGAAVTGQYGTAMSNAANLGINYTNTAIKMGELVPAGRFGATASAASTRVSIFSAIGVFVIKAYENFGGSYIDSRQKAAILRGYAQREVGLMRTVNWQLEPQRNKIIKEMDELGCK